MVTPNILEQKMTSLPVHVPDRKLPHDWHWTRGGPWQARSGPANIVVDLNLMQHELVVLTVQGRWAGRLHPEELKYRVPGFLRPLNFFDFAVLQNFFNNPTKVSTGPDFWYFVTCCRNYLAKILGTQRQKINSPSGSTSRLSSAALRPLQLPETRTSEKVL